MPSLYFDQLIGRKEAQYDWAKFVWIGSPVLGEYQMYMRADTPYKTIEDVRNAKEPPRCGAQGTSDTAYYMPKLFEETIGTKFNLVQGYPGGPEIDLAVERGEIHCRAFTIEAFLSREPYHTWRKKGFVRNIIQTGKKRDAKLPDTPTIWELMDKYKTPEQSRRLASVVLASGALGPADDRYTGHSTGSGENSPRCLQRDAERSRNSSPMSTSVNSISTPRSAWIWKSS